MESRTRLWRRIMLRDWLLRLWNDQRGQDLIEYALLAATIAVVVAGFLPPAVMPAVSTIFSKITSRWPSAKLSRFRLRPNQQNQHGRQDGRAGQIPDPGSIAACGGAQDAEQIRADQSSQIADAVDGADGCGRCGASQQGGGQGPKRGQTGTNANTSEREHQHAEHDAVARPHAPG